MSRGAHVCAACGAKNHAGWRKCQRCGHELPAQAVKVAPPGRQESGGQRRVLLGVAAAVMAIAAAGFAAWPARTRVPAARAAARPAAARPVAAVHQGDGARAADAEEHALTPVTADDFLRAGEGAYAQGNVGVALSAFEAAVAAHPDDPDAQNNLGQVLVRLGRAKDAIAPLETAAALLPDRWTYRFNLARARGLAGEWEAAVADYEIAARLFPDDYVTTTNLAAALEHVGQFDESVAAYEKAVALAPSESSLLLALGRGYERVNRAADAARTYRAYLDAQPDAPDAAKIRAHLDAIGTAAAR